MTPPNHDDAEDRGFYALSGYAGQPAPVCEQCNGRGCFGGWVAEDSPMECIACNGTGRAKPQPVPQAKPWDRVKDAQLAAAVKRHVQRCGPVNEPKPAEFAFRLENGVLIPLPVESAQ